MTKLGFRCDGGAEIGLGHVVGSLRLAGLAAMELGIEAAFVMREGAAAVNLVRRAGFPVEAVPPGVSPEEDVTRLVAKARESGWSGVVVNFCKGDLERYAPLFSRIKEAGLKLIFMDNPIPPSYLLGDLVINALPHPDYPGYDPSSHPACYDGLAYYLVGGAFQPYVKRERGAAPEVRRVLVAMGGGDPGNTTGVVLEGLATAGYRGHVDVVLGPANPRERGVREQFGRLGLAGEVNRGVSDMATRIWQADVGFSALGLTTYEMALLGLPALLISGNPLNAEVAGIYSGRYGGCLHLGMHPDVPPVEVARRFAEVLDPASREALSRAGRRAVDGRGAARVVALMDEVVDVAAGGGGASGASAIAGPGV